MLRFTMPTCTHCHTQFTITPEDMAFYQKIAVPVPTLCPQCRLQRRLAFRNERHLYSRRCDLCHKTMVAIFPAHVPFPVYCGDCWWSDRWDPLSYGRPVDWQRPFFEQFADLLRAVPKAGVLQLNNENSEYNALLAFSKNTYMSPGCYLMENCFFVRKSQSCKDCLNSAFINKCELVAESTNCENCYSSHHLVNSSSCSFSSFLMDCSNLQHSFMCCGVHNQEYCFKNKSYSPKAFQNILANYATKSPAEVLKEFRSFCATVPKRAQIQINCENSTGDYLFNCHNAIECFDCFDVDNGMYILESNNVKDSMDLSLHDKEIELCYEVCSGGEKNYLTKFSFCPVAAPECEYTYSCFHLKNSFGCAGFHSPNQFCLLNTAYSETEYTTLRQRLITQMRQAGEYGEFFPAWLSPFAYNESTAQDYLPLTPEQTEAQGFRWQPEADPLTRAAASSTSVQTCQLCNKPYRVLEEERQLYQKLDIAPSPFCTDCRQRQLMTLKNPRKLYRRTCARCQKSIDTTYAPDRPEQVYCERCYQQEMY